MKRRASIAKRLSVILPLGPNEAAWTGLLEQLQALPADCEVILVRTGAEPLTLPAEPSPRASTSPRIEQIQAVAGRARQMNAGARAAESQWLWFLHADTRLTAQTLPALHAFLARSRPALGYFRLGFLRDGPRLTVLNAMGANLRSAWLGLPFGDQGFVIQARQFHQLGGFDESLAFGEDHALIWRARQAGVPVVGLRARVLTSARKYAAHGWLSTTWRHWRLTVAQAAPAWRQQKRGVGG